MKSMLIKLHWALWCALAIFLASAGMCLLVATTSQAPPAWVIVFFLFGVGVGGMVPVVIDEIVTLRSSSDRNDPPTVKRAPGYVPPVAPRTPPPGAWDLGRK